MKSHFKKYLVKFYSETDKLIDSNEVISYEDEESIKDYEMMEFVKMNKLRPTDFKCVVERL